MKKILLALAATIFTTGVFAQEWTLDKAHSNVAFSVVHLKISEVDGSFGKFDTKFTSSKPDFSDAVIDFTADVASVNTRIAARDKHLRSDDFFSAEKYSYIKFKSNSVKKVSGTKYKITGDLTIRDVTKTITLDATIRGPIDAQGGKQRIGIKATGTIDRTDFGVGKSGGAVDNEVELNINGEFIK